MDIPIVTAKLCRVTLFNKGIIEAKIEDIMIYENPPALELFIINK